MSQSTHSQSQPPRRQRLGRPRKAAEELRTEEARCRLSPAEKQQLAEDAQLCGLSEAGYLRELILGHKPQAQGRCDPRLLFELNAIGVNLNQAVRDVHCDSPRRHDWEQLYQQLQAVLEKVALSDVC